MIAGLKDYARTARVTADNIQQATVRAMTGMEDALVAFVTTGKLEFASLANSIIADLARILIRRNVTGPIADAFGSVFGGLFGGGDLASLRVPVPPPDRLADCIPAAWPGKPRSHAPATSCLPRPPTGRRRARYPPCSPQGRRC